MPDTPLQANVHPNPGHGGGRRTWLWVVLAAVLIAAAAGGVYYWQQRTAKQQKATRQAEITRLESEATELQNRLDAATEAADAAANSPANLAALSKFTDDVYWLYLGELADQPTAARLDGLIAKKYLSDDFIAVAKKAKNGDPMVCSQNPLEFEQYDFETPKIKGDTATQVVAANVPNGGKITFRINLVKEANNKWLIDSVDCKKV